jgi:hypothetical protein
MALFDLKEGFCSNSWGTAKRFCCIPHHGRLDGVEEVCGDWVEWGEFLAPYERGGRTGHWVWGGEEFMAYGLVAVSEFLSFWGAVTAYIWTARFSRCRILFDHLFIIVGSTYHLERLHISATSVRAHRCGHGKLASKNINRKTVVVEPAPESSRRGERPAWYRGSAEEGDVLRCWKWYSRDQDNTIWRVVIPSCLKGADENRFRDTWISGWMDTHHQECGTGFFCGFWLITRWV